MSAAFLRMFRGSIRLSVLLPATALMPTISETSARWNLAPRPPFGPVLSHKPKTSPVGQTLNKAVAFLVLASVNDLPMSESRKS